MANYRDIAIMSVNHGINELGLSISDEEKEQLIRLVQSDLFKDEDRYFHRDLFKKAVEDILRKRKRDLK